LRKGDPTAGVDGNGIVAAVLTIKDIGEERKRRVLEVPLLRKETSAVEKRGAPVKRRAPKEVKSKTRRVNRPLHVAEALILEL
jgi:hypothetical protein